MNGYEAEVERLLIGERPHGYEELTFRLGPDCRYTPDFWVLADDDTLELWEVKGHWRDDAKVKIRVAAERYPQFRWRAFEKVPRGTMGGVGGWVELIFGAKDASPE